LGALLRGLTETGMAILLVEHHIEMVLAVCEAIWVLDFGRLIASGSPNEVRTNDAVKVAYLGERYAANA
jgi:branched-chain amino acid transport system ATP-binding protein